MKSSQELIHWLEQGVGSRWIIRVALGLTALLFTGWYSWTQFHGIPTEFVMQQAVLGRQVAQGKGFTTLVNYPQTYAVLKAKGIPFDENKPYPELYHAPLYSLVLATGFLFVPGSVWQSRPAQPGAWTPDGWGPDYVILAINLVLFWVGIWLVWRLGKKLFDGRAAWLAALATVASVSLWQQTIALTGLPLFVVLLLAVFNVLADLEDRLADSSHFSRRLAVRAGVLGALAGLVFLTEYSGGLVALVLAGYFGWRFHGPVRVRVIAIFAGVFLLLVGPWLVRNVVVSGHPLGLAWQNLALKAGDSTAEPAAQRNLGSVEPPSFSLNKLGNKGLTGMELNLKERIWSGGGMMLTAFFIAGLAYRFRHGPVNRLRWCFAIMAFVLLAGQPFLNSGESPRLPAYYLAPLIIVLGAGFFLVLVDSQQNLTQHWKWVAAGLLLLQGLPLLRDSLEPKKIHFYFPPYYPSLFIELHKVLHERFLPDTGVATDVPAGSAWYGRTRVWAKPERLRDFSQIIVEQNIGALLLTPVTLDRPFFTELAARKDDTISLTDTGGWGGVYAGLVTRRMPASFPLSLPPEKLTENMVLLVNPQTMRRR